MISAVTNNSGAHHMQRRTAGDVTFEAAMLVKAKEHQEMQGEAAKKLIDAAGSTGKLIDTHA